MNVSQDEQLVFEFLRKWEACVAPAVLTKTEAPRCNNCDSIAVGVEVKDTGLIICSKCSGVLESRRLANDASSLRPRNFSGGDEGGGIRASWGYTTDEHLASNPLARDPLKSDPWLRQLYIQCPAKTRHLMRETYKPMNYYHYQQYRRKYHLNERIKMRNNTEPRIPPEDLLQIRMIILARLPMLVLPDDIDSAAVNTACRALGQRFMPYAERWLQVRYFILTGRLENDTNVQYDIPPLEPDHIEEISLYFAAIERGFDKLLYLSSDSRRTLKDNYCGRPGPTRGKPGVDYEAPKHARHNLMQYNHVLHTATLACFGADEYRRLRTEFCFPLHKSQSALDNLNQMMEAICAEEQLPFEPLPVVDIDYELGRCGL